MVSTELALIPTPELIEELTRRTTFLGVIVHSEHEYRNEEWGDERVFRVRFNDNLDVSQASRLLSVVAENMDLHRSS